MSKVSVALFHNGHKEACAAYIPLAQGRFPNLSSDQRHCHESDDHPLDRVLLEVHVNRVLQTLRRQKLVELRGRRLTIPNLPALERVAQFSPNYLHLDMSERAST